MNNLEQIMNAKNITPIELAKLTGISAANIRRLIKEGELEYCRKSTVTKLAAALGVTVRELVKGGERMKNKVLDAEVTKHVEALAKALRSYTDEPMYLNLTIFTRDKECHLEGDPEGIPDYYDVRTHEADIEDVEDIDCTFSRTARVYYALDDHEELIRTVIPYKEM